MDSLLERLRYYRDTLAALLIYGNDDERAAAVRTQLIEAFAMVPAEVDALLAAAAEYDAVGEPDLAAAARTDADALREFLPAPVVVTELGVEVADLPAGGSVAPRQRRGRG